eukprot:Opistho-2@85315
MADGEPPFKRPRSELAPNLPTAQAINAAIEAGRKAGNINVGGGDAMPLSDGSKRAAAEHDEVLADFERRRRARTMAVPTDPAAVKLKLREYGEPVTLFGEGPAERRERLRETMSVREGITVEKDDAVASGAGALEKTDSAMPSQSVWYHEGPDALRDMRAWIASASLPRAKERLRAARVARSHHDPARLAATADLHRQLRTASNSASQIGDDRPLSHCAFSPDGHLLATASWSGLCKLWSVPDCRPVRTLRGHNERVGAIVFHPQAGTTQHSASLLNMLSCAADGTVCMWDLQGDTPIARLDPAIHGHQRVARVAFHPTGRLFGTACYDKTWRLFDAETRQELLVQEGHSRAVHAIAFQGDGSLVATGGLDAVGRLWDLRTGKCIMLLAGHVKSVFAVDFAPDAYRIATGSEDHTVRIWDVRKRSSVYTIGAHTNLVSFVKFQPGEQGGHCLVTAGYDNTARVWTHPGWVALRTLAGHENKVMCVDVTGDGRTIATASYDRTFKLWAPE